MFKEDLSQGRLVAAGWEETLVNLQSKPVRYTWAQPLLAAKTPGTSSSSDNGIDESAAKAPEGGMDVD